MMRSLCVVVVVVVACVVLLTPSVMATSTCFFNDGIRGIDMTSFTGQMITVQTQPHYQYSLFPCGSVPHGFCGNPNIQGPSPSFFCQYDYSLDVNRTLAYQLDNSTQVQTLNIRDDRMNVVYQSGHMCFNKSRIANITYQCICQQNNTTFDVIESPRCTYNAMVRSSQLCSVFGITCPNTPTSTPTTARPTWPLTTQTPTPTPTPTPTATTRPTSTPTPTPTPTPSPTNTTTRPPTTPTPTNTTTRPPTTPPPTRPPTTPPPTPSPGKTCSFDSDCSASSYCLFHVCTRSIPIDGRCNEGLKSRKQCDKGACDYYLRKCIPLAPAGGACNSDTIYPCDDGNYCRPLNATSINGTCTKTLSNGQACTLSDGSECDSGYCAIPANSKAGTCQTHPFAELIKAAALGLVAIVLIAIGGCVVVGISICCCVYRTCKPRPPVVVHEAPHVHAYHAPYRHLQDGYTRV